MPVHVVATIQATLPRLVRCAHCGTEFLYTMRVTGAASVEADGSAYKDYTARGKSEKEARANLTKQLNDPYAFEPVPCPDCLRYQPYMCERLVEEQVTGPLRVLGYTLAALGGAVAVGGALTLAAGSRLGSIPVVALVVGLGVALIGGGVLTATGWAASRYDPNREKSGERKRLAKTRTMSLEQFDESQLARARDAYTDFEPLDDVDGATDDNPFENQKTLTIEWWVPQSVLRDGGTISLAFSKTRSATVVVPKGSKSGDVFDLRVYTPKITPFQVRVMALRVRPEKRRGEEE